jgi:hypothetical protein
MQLHHHFIEQNDQNLKEEIQKNQIKIAQKKME